VTEGGVARGDVKRQIVPHITEGTRAHRS